jgi:hypothetical protein
MICWCWIVKLAVIDQLFDVTNVASSIIVNGKRIEGNLVVMICSRIFIKTKRNQNERGVDKL